jgi:hypothetical protein
MVTQNNLLPFDRVLIVQLYHLHTVNVSFVNDLAKNHDSPVSHLKKKSDVMYGLGTPRPFSSDSKLYDVH